MRRRLHRFLPVILTALIIQILAPIAASWVTFAAASDPLGTNIICHGSPDSSPGQSDQGRGALHDGACFACCALHAITSIDPPPVATFANPYREAERVAWRHHVLRFSTARTGSNSQARGPPQAI
ncbi:DUF2946 family protein [Bradyrhizobium sp.]|uniref:DUF2946 family protein n=1 Tax=Bradyrhizobium sp. TaxID=376 RepID=UPI003C584875